MANVLLADPLYSDFRSLAKGLAALRGVPAIDAQQEARRAWGLLAENVSDGDAAQMAETLAAHGVPVKIAGVLPAAPAAREIHRLRMAPDAVAVTVGVPPTEASLPRRPVLVVSAVALNEDTSETVTVKEGPSNAERLIRTGITLTTGIPLGFGGAKEVRKTVKGHELLLRFDILTDQYRLFGRAERFHFSDGAPAAGGIAHLRDLLANLPQDPGVLFNLGARALLAGKPLTTLGYDSMSAYERENRWLYALAHLKT